MSLLRRISNLLSRSKMDHEIDAELRSHLEMRTEDNIAAGMRPDEAHRDALVRFGNLTSTKEKVAGADAALTLHSIFSDVRFAWRLLWKNPGFSCTAILVLALGMSAGVAIFAFVDAVLIRPLPYQNPSRLIALFESTTMGPRFHLSYLDYLDWKRQNSVFTSLEAYDNVSLALNTNAGAQRVDGGLISAGFLRTLGVAPILGRDFRDGEDSPSAPRIVILSYSAWQSRYGGRPDVLGQAVSLDGAVYTIIGVLPREFYFAPTGTAEFWTTLHESSDPNGRGDHGLAAIARLKDGVTLGMASSEMSRIAGLLAKQYPDADDGRGATVMLLTELIVGNLRPILLLLLSGSLLLLLIACVNVSGLMLVRSENRLHEIAVRGALGASRGRLNRQFVTEGAMLAIAGSLAGLGAAYVVIHLMVSFVPVNMLQGMPYLRQLGVNLHTAVFAVATGLAMTVLFSLTPIVRLSLTDLRSGLMEGGRTGARTSWKNLGAKLVVLELCAAMTLLFAAGLLGKSFYRLLHTDIGVQADHLAMMRLSVQRSSPQKDEQLVALAKRITEEAGRLPGVQSVAIAHQVPVANFAAGNTTFDIIGRPQHGVINEASGREVSAGYFRTLEARLLHGRYFTDADDASKPHVMIVNQSFARKYFPGVDPLGKQIRYDPESPIMEIVGVVDNIREGPLDAEVQPVLYTPFLQGPASAFYVIVRTANTPQQLLKPLEEVVREVDRSVLVFNAETMEDRINHTQSTYLHRSSAWLVGGFAAIALVLGVVGLYGVIAYSVSQRTKEIGVRMALGAQRGSVCQLILKDAGRLVLGGIMAGSVCSVMTASLMRKLLFGTQPWDAGTLAAVALMLSLSTLAASYIPARRAASVDPVVALRAE